MPCYDPQPSIDAAETRERCNTLTRWLCSVLGALEASGIEMELSDPELRDWWETHKAWDKARKEAQQ